MLTVGRKLNLLLSLYNDVEVIGVVFMYPMHITVVVWYSIVFIKGMTLLMNKHLKS